VGYTQRGNAVPGVSPYKTTNPSDFDPARDRFLNPDAFRGRGAAPSSPVRVHYQVSLAVYCSVRAP